MADSKLLRSLREALYKDAPQATSPIPDGGRNGMFETTSTAVVPTYFGRSPKQRRKNRLNGGPTIVGKLAEKANADDLSASGFAELTMLFLEGHSRAVTSGRNKSEKYLELVEELNYGLSVGFPPEVLKGTYHRLLSLLGESVGLSGPATSDEYEDLHKKFVGKLEKEFGIEAKRWRAVAEGVYVDVDAEGTSCLSDEIERLRQFANENSYVLIKKGTTDDLEGLLCCDDALWVFVYDCNHTTEDLGTFENP